jgi:hypothetical protein
LLHPSLRLAKFPFPVMDESQNIFYNLWFKKDRPFYYNEMLFFIIKWSSFFVERPERMLVVEISTRTRISASASGVVREEFNFSWACKTTDVRISRPNITIKRNYVILIIFSHRFILVQSNSVITNSSGPAIFVCYNRGSL